MLYATAIIFANLQFYLAGRMNSRIAPFLLLIGLAPLVLLVALRGDVGVDTAAYISIIESLNERDLFDFFIEPAFLIYSRVLLSVDVAPRFILNSLGLINIFLLLYAFRKIDNSNLLFPLIVMPIFLLDYSMNGIRAGLAACFIAIAYHHYVIKNSLKFWTYSVLAVLSHISFLYLVALILIESLRHNKINLLVFMIITAGILFGADNTLNTYLFGKVAIYLAADVEPILGLAPLALNALMLALITYSAKRRRQLRKIATSISILAISTVCLYLLVPIFPWFAVRFMWLNLLYATITGSNLYSNENTKANDLEILALLCIGVLGLASHIRQFILFEGQDLSPYLPYRFFWD